jgi:hypothetical protein
MFAEDGGPSLAERFSRCKVPMIRADNKRVGVRGMMGGWDMLRARLNGESDDRPMICCFNTCSDSIRTIPALQHDEMKPEDVNTDMEDHAADEWRYACMSRPWVKEPEIQRDPLEEAKQPLTFDQQMRYHEQQERQRQRL